LTSILPTDSQPDRPIFRIDHRAEDQFCNRRPNDRTVDSQLKPKLAKFSCQSVNIAEWKSAALVELGCHDNQNSRMDRMGAVGVH
jgi:hypothetical protein